MIDELIQQTNSIIRGIQKEIRLLSTERRQSRYPGFYDDFIQFENARLEWLMAFRKRLKDGTSPIAAQSGG